MTTIPRISMQLSIFCRQFRWLPGLLLLAVAGCGSNSSKPVGDSGNAPEGPADTAPPISNPRDIKLTDANAARVSVYSNPPGCMVFVDLAPVHNDKDGLALTPCEFTLPHGSYSISVERPGGKRAAQPLQIEGDREVEFDVSSSPGELDEPSLLNAPLFEAAVGRAIPLASLNSTGKELDPFLSPDGRTIYFVSDRDGNRGIYTATRLTPYHDFDAPTIVLASSGADLPTSPSVSDDSLIMMYAVPEKSRLWQLTRAGVEARFDNKEIMRSDEKQERPWLSAQLSGDGLRIYWTEEAADTTVTRAAVRSAPTKLFGKTLAFDLPGHHPHLSDDGLRQYSFDGTKLLRHRRGSLRQPFGESEVVAEVTIDDYVTSPQHRQFWVSEDEQWLYYCNDPQRSGDLFVVRLSDGPGWGRTYVGKAIADKMAVAKSDPEDQPKPEMKPADTVDPRTLPLPYTTHWKKLEKLLESNSGDEAVALVKQAQQQPELAGDRELLAWDLQLAEALAGFNQDVHHSLQSLKPGAIVRAGGNRFEFERFDAETLHLKLKDKEITKKLSDLSPGERVSLAEAGPDKPDAAKAFRFGTFLYFQGKLQQPVAEGWFKKAGPEGEQFDERLAARVLHQAKGELARGNTSAGIVFLDAVATVAGPDTNAAKLASQQRATLYDTLTWNMKGPRKWQRGEQGEFIADSKRENGSYLVSDQTYADFELTCEWKVQGRTAMGGILLRQSGEGKPVEKGAKIQLANDPDLRKMDPFATGALFGVTSPDSNAGLPEGKWNTLRLQVRGKDVKGWVNGTEVLTATLPDTIPESGHVMLDGVVGGISYRKVLLYGLVDGAK